MTDSPNPLEAAVECIIAQLSEEDGASLKNATADDMIMMHFGLGMWIRNNLGLREGSPLRNFLADRGISHEDDMSGGVIRAVRARLRGENCVDALNPGDQSDAT